MFGGKNRNNNYDYYENMQMNRIYYELEAVSYTHLTLPTIA